MKPDLDLVLVQWRVVPGDPDANLSKAKALLAQTKPKRESIILLPEMFSCGFFYRDLERIAAKSGETLEWMSQTARFFGSCLSGSLPVLTDCGVVNRMVFFDEEGKMCGAYDKVHLFPPTGEEDFFVAGDRAVTLTWKGIGIGLAICFDLRFPEFGRCLLDEGTKIMVVSAQWPSERLDHFRDLVKVRALENQFFVAACNSCGEDGKGHVLGGSSMVAGPSGEVRGALGTREEGVLSLNLPLGEVDRSRERFPVVKRRRLDLYCRAGEKKDEPFGSGG